MRRDHQGNLGLLWLSEGNTTIAYFRRSLLLQRNAGSHYMQDQAMKPNPGTHEIRMPLSELKVSCFFLPESGLFKGLVILPSEKALDMVLCRGEGLNTTQLFRVLR